MGVPQAARSKNDRSLSHSLRGLRKKAGMDDAVPAFIDAEMAPIEFRKNWARLIIMYDRCFPVPAGQIITKDVDQILHHTTCCIQ
jgi:hypothetical protein